VPTKTSHTWIEWIIDKKEMELWEIRGTVRVWQRGEDAGKQK
jgi:hypothetical protein